MEERWEARVQLNEWVTMCPLDASTAAVGEESTEREKGIGR